MRPSSSSQAPKLTPITPLSDLVTELTRTMLMAAGVNAALNRRAAAAKGEVIRVWSSTPTGEGDIGSRAFSSASSTSAPSAFASSSPALFPMRRVDSGASGERSERSDARRSSAATRPACATTRCSSVSRSLSARCVRSSAASALAHAAAAASSTAATCSSAWCASVSNADAKRSAAGARALSRLAFTVPRRVTAPSMAASRSPRRRSSMEAVHCCAPSAVLVSRSSLSSLAVIRS